MDKIRVMVVDDSALMRKIIRDMIEENEDMEVVAVARNGIELLNNVNMLKPDVITLDIEMPKMDGLTALKELKRKGVTAKIIMLSSLTAKGADITLECLENGAFDFIQKPSGAISLDINKVQGELVNRIRSTITSKKMESRKVVVPKAKAINNNINMKIDALVLGASTGGPKAITEVITKLPGNLGFPILIVQHMPKGFTKAFADRLNKNSKLTVVEGKNGDFIENNTVYIAPGGYHMEVSRERKLSMNQEPPIWGVRPAVDKLFISAAEVYKSNLASVILTGMGRDGAKGTEIIKSVGGITISEDESTCTIYGMPKAAYETGKVDEVIPLYKIPDKIKKLSKV